MSPAIARATMERPRDRADVNVIAFELEVLTLGRTSQRVEVLGSPVVNRLGERITCHGNSPSQRPGHPGELCDRLSPESARSGVDA